MDKIEERIQHNKELCEEMPYLIPTDVFGERIEKYDYSYTWLDNNELPKGWQGHFRKLCEAIKEPLKRTGHIDTFFFTQVKEKFDTMRCYHNGCSEEVQEIIDEFERESSKICACCGNPATCYTTGYILSYCDECAKTLKCKFKSFKKDGDVI